MGDMEDFPVENGDHHPILVSDSMIVSQNSQNYERGL